MKINYDVPRISENETKNQIPLTYQFNLGDIVTINSNPLLARNQKIITDVSKVSVPPFMIITEILQEKNKHKFKLKCQYYSHKQAKFIENYFDNDIIDNLSQNITLQRIQINILKEQIKDAKDENKKKELSAKMKEIDSKLKKEEYSESFPIDNNKISLNDIIKVLGKKVVVFKSFFLENTFKGQILTQKNEFLSPFMTIKAIEMEKGDNNIYDKQSGKVIREVSLYKIKCMWYNPIDCKFSEEWFIPEALISIEEK